MVGKTSVILLASAARTTTTTVDRTTPEDFPFDSKRPQRTFPTTAEASLFHFILDVTAVSGSASIVLAVSGYDIASAKYYAILTATAVTTTGTNVFKIGASMPGTANLTANDFLTERFKVVITHGTADSITYSLGMNCV